MTILGKQCRAAARGAQALIQLCAIIVGFRCATPVPALAQEIEPQEDAHQKRIREAMARVSASHSEVVTEAIGREWGLDALVAYGLLDGQPQTAFYQGSGIGMGVEGHFMVCPWLGGEAEVQYASFGGIRGPSGSLVMPAGGLRINPFPNLDWGSYYFAAHAGEAFTGGIARFGFDVAAGIEWDFGLLQVGPTLRFIDVTAQPSTNQLGGDAHIILIGVSLGLGSRKPRITVMRRTLMEEPALGAEFGSLAGTVRDLEGRPLDARVLVVSLNDHGGDSKTLDAAPRYEARLPAGSYHLQASASGYRRSSREVIVDPDEVVESNFKLVPLRDEADDGSKSGRGPGAVLTATEIEVNQTIEFELDSARLREDAQPILGEVASIIRQHPDLRICIEGHTDDTGDDAYNLELSWERAESVRSFLYGAGIRTDRLETHGYGFTRPLVPNDSQPARARNRRVQFKVMPPGCER